MKNQIKSFVISLGGKCPKYSGKTKTMFVEQQYHDDVIAKFGYNLPFKLDFLLSERKSVVSI